ncbi:predicted protein [Thalassiosira pseudonana CCMP1335]|uniref:Uncharacterized protein n=1 Tax=Thalassiosira pseudonana TaxID=35128 RepID=B8C957_THAPS|nr:predicted protein [Thalassiosira pseudonana CCMP1335]EED89794.1 predicted protein [Thalassiosira pseudonana CCMP1335]|eukprot:g5846.t1 g5846   contig20:282741-283766(+)
MLFTKLKLALISTAIVAIIAGVGIGIASKSANNDNLQHRSSASLTTANDCAEETIAAPVVRRRIFVNGGDDEFQVLVAMMPTRRRALRREMDGSSYGWLEEDEETFGRKLEVSMSLSMSAVSFSKGAKAMKGKSGKGLSKQSKCKGGKSHKLFNLCSTKSKAHNGANHSKAKSSSVSLSLNFDLANGSISKGKAPSICGSDSSMPSFYPTIGSTTSNPTPRATPIATTASPTSRTTPRATTTSPPTLRATPRATTSPPTPRATPMTTTPPSLVVILSNERTMSPTSGSTPTVSTEVSGPPTKPGREVV